ncbi:CapA family protein, partial [Patescibacteria group bacterium]|nr:CapA family protein [Patescibacteria group bacterium]
MKILFVGDVMLGRLVNEALKKLQPSYVWGDTLSIFNTANLRICNLECVISDIGEPWSITPKVFHFRTDSKNVDALKIAGVDPVSIANNHTLDYGYEALFQMMKILGDNAINYAGAGANIQDASMPAVCEINKKKIGFIAFTDNEPDWEATETKPGIYYVPIDLTDARAINLFKNIKRTKKDLCDLLIVSAHWGP